jgi:hypothetical protein
MPKLCRMRASVDDPFSWPMTQTDVPRSARSRPEWPRPRRSAVAGERREILDQPGAVIDEMRPLRVARDQRLLPGGQRGVEVLQRRRRLGLQPRDVVADRDRVALLAQRPQLLDLGLELGTGFSKSR